MRIVSFYSETVSVRWLYIWRCWYLKQIISSFDSHSLLFLCTVVMHVLSTTVNSHFQLTASVSSPSWQRQTSRSPIIKQKKMRLNASQWLQPCCYGSHRKTHVIQMNNWITSHYITGCVRFHYSLDDFFSISSNHIRLLRSPTTWIMYKACMHKTSALSFFFLLNH